jgi:hypothetical protein
VSARRGAVNRDGLARLRSDYGAANSREWLNVALAALGCAAVVGATLFVGLIQAAATLFVVLHRFATVAISVRRIVV